MMARAEGPATVAVRIGGRAMPAVRSHGARHLLDAAGNRNGWPCLIGGQQRQQQTGPDDQPDDREQQAPEHRAPRRGAVSPGAP